MAYLPRFAQNEVWGPRAGIIGFLVAVIGFLGAVMGTHILWALGTHMLWGLGSPILWVLGTHMLWAPGTHFPFGLWARGGGPWGGPGTQGHIQYAPPRFKEAAVAYNCCCNCIF